MERYRSVVTVTHRKVPEPTRIHSHFYGFHPDNVPVPPEISLSTPPSGLCSLNVSLKASGKSRADLWAFAVITALEYAIENNDIACDMSDLGKVCKDANVSIVSFLLIFF